MPLAHLHAARDGLGATKMIDHPGERKDIGGAAHQAQDQGQTNQGQRPGQGVARRRVDRYTNRDAEVGKHKGVADLSHRLEIQVRGVLGGVGQVVVIVVRQGDGAKEQGHDARQAKHFGRKIRRIGKEQHQGNFHLRQVVQVRGAFECQ